MLHRARRWRRLLSGARGRRPFHRTDTVDHSRNPSFGAHFGSADDTVMTGLIPNSDWTQQPSDTGDSSFSTSSAWPLRGKLRRPMLRRPHPASIRLLIHREATPKWSGHACAPKSLIGITPSAIYRPKQEESLAAHYAVPSPLTAPARSNRPHTVHRREGNRPSSSESCTNRAAGEP